ncbi:type III secretion system apparatus protein YscQ/HrcQ [Cupriavidus sp. YR651]|uniref:type III secretion system cytoplasmic ring protein SctQ n=1 Tax=Cupriavidus sp. YR651 TaxID=1855315 RepID=UPI00088852C1|nr:type III secretion system cytoplasmic ring protein SctQ [Cupriavidus sp. YR651]SDD38637.1 type III secretion system apparatus protein YscQ/HrcQ [Cupriavidus sp. YR651]
MGWRAIRKTSRAALNASCLIGRWRERCLDPARLGLPEGARLAKVTAAQRDVSWSGYVELDEWLSYIAPELGALAGRGAPPMTDIVRLLNGMDHPLAIPGEMAELDYVDLVAQPCGPADRIDGTYWSVRLDSGRLWLATFPTASARPTQASGIAATVPLLADIRLGRTALRSGLLGTIRCGDIVLIREACADIALQGRRIGYHKLTEEGHAIMQELEPTEGMERITDPAPGGIDGVTGADSADGKPIDITLVPVELQFILQRRQMTIGELDGLHRGAYLPLDPAAERNVALVVNGVVIGTGELVEIDGNLGVEIHRIGGEPGR